MFLKIKAHPDIFIKHQLIAPLKETFRLNLNFVVEIKVKKNKIAEIVNDGDDKRSLPEGTVMIEFRVYQTAARSFTLYLLPGAVEEYQRIKRMINDYGMI